MSQKILAALNKQIRLEMESAYLYLAMAMKMNEAKYGGFSSWLYKQYKEEVEHAEDFILFAQKTDHSVELSALAQPVVCTEEPLEIAKMVLEHERMISKSIHDLYELAMVEKDYPTLIFAQKYIEEQIEEEDSARSIVDKFTFAAGHPAARYAVDKELSMRQ